MPKDRELTEDERSLILNAISAYDDTLRNMRKIALLKRVAEETLPKLDAVGELIEQAGAVIIRPMPPE